MTEDISVHEYWACENSSYCNGVVNNLVDRKKCWNCGMRRDDKRRKAYPITKQK